MLLELSDFSSQRTVTIMLKRATDIVLSLAALTVLAPLILVIGTGILICDGRPIFYRGIRTGRFGKHFRIFKFRTMVVDAERLGGSATADTDVRITGFGRLLRRHKFDEVPQLINVLRGEMSLVGPRPEVPEYVALLSKTEQRILTVRPGITDWATLWDSDEGALLALTSQPEQLYKDFIRPQKVKLQLEYVRRQSFWIDLLILWKTAYVVICKPIPPSLALLNSRSGGLPLGTIAGATGVGSQAESSSGQQGNVAET